MVRWVESSAIVTAGLKFGPVNVWFDDGSALVGVCYEVQASRGVVYGVSLSFSPGVPSPRWTEVVGTARR